MITFKQSGDFRNIEKLLERALSGGLERKLHDYGAMGVKALEAATPVDTGLTAASWSYEINMGKSSSSITWTNSNIQNGVPVAVILQYGHATGNGGYVQGVDYINPALAPIFQSIADSAWEEVTNN